MTAKKAFVAPHIVSENSLDAADRDFPLMPLVVVSGGSSDASDGPGGDINLNGLPDASFDGND